MIYPRAIPRPNGRVVEVPLKAKNFYRNISISGDTIEVLEAQKKKVTGEYVFPSPNGNPISPDSVLHMLLRVLARAGLPKVRFHDLRHTFATMALQNGVDVKTVSSMLGHYSAGVSRTSKYSLNRVRSGEAPFHGASLFYSALV